ncbi:ABC transporter substrate-binding protein [Bradyrhizobium sp. Arg314]
MITKETHGVSRRKALQLGVAAGALAATSTRLFAADTQKLKIIHSSPATLLLWSVSYLAEDLGFYHNEGIEIERVGLASGPAGMTALLAREGIANFSAPGECLAANARGQSIKIIEAYARSDGYTLMVTKAFAEQHGITAASPLADREGALKAMRGMRFGITAPASHTNLLTRLAAQQVGLNPATDIAIVPVGSVVNVVSAISQNALDGGFLLSPFAEQAGAEFGAVPLISSSEIHQAARLQGQVLETRPKDLEGNRELLEAFVRADLRALRFLQETPDEARDKLRRTRFPKIAESIWPSVWASQLPVFATPYVPKDSLKAWIETGTIGGNPDPETFPYDTVIDMSLVDEGLRKLGWTPKGRS